MSPIGLSLQEEPTNLAEAEYSSKNLDHLGIVAEMCREIGLAEEIDSALGVDPRQKVTCGEAVVAMVLNALGFVDRPLYLFPEFMETKPVEILIRDGLKVEDFNDDVLGRTLDKLYSACPESIFMRIAAKAYTGYGGRFFHNDTTSMSLQGDYEHEEGDLDAVPLEITYGYSKDNRPDLKQFLISLVTNGDLPVFIQALSGNASDKNHFREIVKSYGASLREMWGEDRIWVWDSAFYSERNVKEVSGSYTWITRVPETLSKAKEVMETLDGGMLRKTSIAGYQLISTVVEYGGVKQRWIVVFSEKAFSREKGTLEKKIEKERAKAEKELWHASNQPFNSREDGLHALRATEKAWKYHHVKGIEFEERRKRNGEGRGRPKNGEELQHVYYSKASFEEDEAAIEKELLRRGRFIVATNELDSEKISDEEVLKAYKEQQYAERGFRFLKDPLFFAHSIFLKNEGRIVALVMIMGLALMVYSLAEHKLRAALAETGETLPDQRKKPTKRPTIRRVFQVFEGITVLYIGSKKVKVLNIKPLSAKILSLLGREYERIYSY
jgi:transposase